uniref:Uncharacterized protein n=1 Tax=Strigamia maritima TaxID=126957 RepID=T1J9K1_STRMM
MVTTLVKKSVSMCSWLLRLLSDWILDKWKIASGWRWETAIEKNGVTQALSYYYCYTSEKIKTAKDPKITDCCHPAIIFFFDGYVLFLYGAVITHQVSVQPLIKTHRFNGGRCTLRVVSRSV